VPSIVEGVAESNIGKAVGSVPICGLGLGIRSFLTVLMTKMPGVCSAALWPATVEFGGDWCNPALFAPHAAAGR